MNNTTIEELNNLIKTKEGPYLEFKESYSTNIGKTLCAFSNSSGGKIILGVKDNHEIIGFNLTNRIQSEIIDLARHIDPSIEVNIEKINNQLSIITIFEGKDKPYSYAGNYYIRIGATSQKLKRDELKKFFQEEGLVLFDEQICKKFNLETNFNNIAFESFLKKAHISNVLTKEETLKNLSLLEENQIKNAGVLLFCNNITDFFPYARITCVLYKGNDKIDILDKKEFDNDLYSNYNDAFIYICSKLNKNYILKTKEREEKLELPERAIAEALTNAIAHRDYFSTAHVQVDIFLDRIEITNPGSLVSKLSKKDFGKKSVPRNSLLFGLMTRINLGEKAGTGISRIKKEIEEYKLRFEFEITKSFFTIIFYRPLQINTIIKDTARDTVKDTVNLSNNEKIILNKINKNCNITSKELSKIININLRNTKKILAKLKQKGLIKRVGPVKGGFWEILE
ncbi:MAG: RNA-binding domain-containing protein [archaeon]